MSGPYAEWPPGDRFEPVVRDDIEGLRAAIVRGDYPKGQFGWLTLAAEVPTVIPGGFVVVSSAAGDAGWVSIPSGEFWPTIVAVEMRDTGLAVYARPDETTRPGRRLSRAVGVRGDSGDTDSLTLFAPETQKDPAA